MRITGKIYFSYAIEYKSCAPVIVEIIIQPSIQKFRVKAGKFFFPPFLNLRFFNLHIPPTPLPLRPETNTPLYIWQKLVRLSRSLELL